MAQTKEEKNNQNAGSSVDFTAKIQRAKEPFKNEILKMQTKEEKLLYLNQQKQRYVLLKENSNNAYFLSILVSFAVIVSIILLFAKTERSILFTSLMFTLIIIAGIVWTVLFITMKILLCLPRHIIHRSLYSLVLGRIKFIVLPIFFIF